MIGSRLSMRVALGSCIALLCLCGWAPAQGRTGPQDGFLPPDGLETGWYARIQTDWGTIIARLLPEQAPQSVAHFVGLAEGTLEWYDPVTGEPQKVRYYDGISVDLAQAGERFEAGGLAGQPGKTPPVMLVPSTEGRGPVNFSGPGRLGMTRAHGDRVSAVKFFVTATATPHLNNFHPCFGEVVEGREIVLAISRTKTYSNGRPIEPIVIEKIRVFTIGDPDPLAEPVPYTPRPKRFESSGRD